MIWRWMCVLSYIFIYLLCSCTEHTPWNKCMPQWTVCFYLISYETPTWNQKIEDTAMFLRPLKLCPWNNVFNCFVIIHWIVISFNEFSCRSVHRWGNNIVSLHILLCSAVVECEEDRVFRSGKNKGENRLLWEQIVTVFD